MKHAEAPIPTPRGVLFAFDGTLAPNLDLMDMRRQLVVMAEQTDIPRAVYQDLYIVEMIEAGRQLPAPSINSGTLHCALKTVVACLRQSDA